LRLYRRGNPNRFDLRGEKEGYIAILQLSDQKVIEKRDPGLAFMLSKLCARACLETVSQQYEGVSAAAAELKNEVTELTSNKLNDILIGCPGFGAFYQSLETKDKRFFSNLCEVVEIKSEKKILNEYSPMHSIIIVLKGELISFTRNGPGTIFKAGDLLGVKEVLYDLCWKDNVYGRQNGYLVKVKKDFLFDLGNTFAKSAKHFLEYFLKYECMRIKDKFKGVKVGGGGGDAVLLDLNNNEEEEKIAKLASQVERFAEIQVNQKFKPLAGLEAGKEEKELDPFKVIRDPPIMTSLVYKTIMAQDADKLTKKDADKKDESSHKGYSCFIKDKLEFQYLEQKKKDKENKLRKKKGLPIDDGNGPSKTAQQQGKVDPQTIEALEIEYEKLKNDYNLRELSRERLKHEHEEILEKLMKTEKEVQRLKDKNFFVTAERDRLKLHKELAMKVKEVETGQSISIGKLTKSRADQRNFNDVVAFAVIVV
jgi:hypothetical protein